MTTLPSLTLLDAVNDMLLAIGQYGVNTVEISDVMDVSIAKSELVKVTRAFQNDSFAFNTDLNKTMSPDTDGLIAIPSGVVRVHATDRNRTVSIRKHPDGGFHLWDADNLSWEFSEPVECRIVWAYIFEALPPVAQQFAMISAARKFQQRVIGNPQTDQLLAQDEARARLTLQREERVNRNTNVLTQNPQMVRAYRGYRRGA